MLVYNKDDIEFVTEFPCLLGHPVLEFFPIYVNLNTVKLLKYFDIPLEHAWQVPIIQELLNTRMNNLYFGEFDRERAMINVVYFCIIFKIFVKFYIF